MQLFHHNTHFPKKRFPIVLICDNVNKAPNVGSLFRTADAFGIEKIIFCGERIPIGRRMTKTSRATEKTVNYELRDDIGKVINDLNSEGYHIIALEISSNSLSLHSFNFPPCPIALVLGGENHGISEKVLKACDTILHIQMFGQNSSMNVVQATSIALYEISKQIMGNEQH